MKYVKNRDSFLTGIKEYKENDKFKNLELIQEDGGPLHNAVEFGDSWVGRWINNIIRAGKEKVDKMRISGQVRRLKRALDDIIEYSTPNKLSKEDAESFTKLKIHTFLDELNAAIEKGHKVGIIKALTDSAITNITGTEEFEGKKELLQQLKDFKKFLEQFKDDSEGKEDPDFKQKEESGDEDEEDEDDEVNSEDDETKKLFTIIESLKSLALIIDTYKRVKIEAKPTQKEVYTYKTVNNDTIAKIVANPKINIKKLTAEDIRKKNPKTLENQPKDDKNLPAGLKLVMENVEVIYEDQDSWCILNGSDFIIVEKDTFGTGGSADRQNIKTTNQKGELLETGEDHLTQAFSKLKKDIEVLESEKEKGIGITSKFINDITSSYKDPKNRETIKSLYVEINRYLVGDKKATIQEKDALFKENIEVIKDVPKRVIVAEKIARFTKRALQFDGQNLYGGLGDLGKNLQKYVESMKKVMTYKLGESAKPAASLKFKVGDEVTWTNKEGKSITKKIEKIENGKYVFKKDSGEEYTKKEEDIKKTEPKKEEVTGESRVWKFDRFYKLIKEADEPVVDNKGEEMSKTNKLILEYWTKNVDIKKYVYEMTEYEKIIKDLEDKQKELSEGIVFTIDPVLDIVKAFNKAYKLHTTQVIRSGRTGGAVSNRIFMQYTSLGGGSPETAGKSGGPYRNNSIFNKWEEAVLDIIGETKYEKIFSPKTKLKRGDDLVPQAGAYLRKFMSDLLDGDELYKGSSSSGSGGQGAQAKFLDKYFGYKDGTAAVLNDGGEKEATEIGSVSSAVVDSTKIVQFIKTPIKFTQQSELVGTIFKVESGNDSYYFLIHELQGADYLVTYTKGYKFYHDVLCRQGTYGLPKLSDTKGDCSKGPSDSYTSEGGEYIIKATRIEARLFNTDKGTLGPRSYESTYIRKKKEDGKQFKNSITETEKIDTADSINVADGKIFILSYKEGKEDKEPKFIKISKFDLLKDKGVFPNIKATKDIDKVRFKSK